MISDMFIKELNDMLPEGFQAKKFNRMPRIHIKYHHYGFAVIDLREDYYHLYAIEGLFSAVGIQHYDHISNMSNKTNRITRIPYGDMTIIKKLIQYVQENPSEVECFAVQSY